MLSSIFICKIPYTLLFYSFSHPSVPPTGVPCNRKKNMEFINCYYSMDLASFLLGSGLTYLESLLLAFPSMEFDFERVHWSFKFPFHLSLSFILTSLCHNYVDDVDRRVNAATSILVGVDSINMLPFHVEGLNLFQPSLWWISHLRFGLWLPCCGCVCVGNCDWAVSFHGEIPKYEGGEEFMEFKKSHGSHSDQQLLRL